MKEIKDYTNYYITEDGKVYSKKFDKMRELKPFKNEKGYLKISLNKNGKRNSHRISRLVALTYIPNPLNLTDVDHRDCDKTNNHISNLEWVTHSENIKRAKKNDLYLKGEKHPNVKLTQEQVKWIRENYIPYHKELGTRALGRKFDISHTQIKLIIKNKNWVE